MKKTYWNKIFFTWFNIQENSKIIYYRNPSDCINFTNGYEKHKFFHDSHENIIYGYKKGKSSTPMKIGKIISPNLILFVNNIYDKIIYYLGALSDNLGMYMCIYYCMIGLILIGVICNMPIIEGLLHAKKNII